MQTIEVERGTRLQKLVFALVRAGKLLCPNGDMEEEYVAERLDDDVHRTFCDLSLGISFWHRLGISDQHVLLAMEAYVSNAQLISIPSSTYFHDNPLQRLEEARRRRYLVTTGPLKIPYVLENRARSKAEIADHSEKLRRKLISKGQTYEKQLEAENRAPWAAMVEIVRKLEASLLSGRHNFEDYMAATGPYLYWDCWRKLGGQPSGWQGLQNFFYSPYFIELPTEFVSASLHADLVTGNEPIKSGDSMDVQLLSVALPASHYVVTDNRMALRIRQRGLDVRCGTEVYSMSTLDRLFAQLEKL